MTFRVCRTVRKPQINAGVGQTMVCQQERDRFQSVCLQFTPRTDRWSLTVKSGHNCWCSCQPETPRHRAVASLEWPDLTVKDHQSVPLKR
jgi:hypothetical protein